MKVHLRKLSFPGLLAFALLPVVLSAKPSATDTTHLYLKHSFDVEKYKLEIDLYRCYDPPYPSSFKANEIITISIDSALNSVLLNAVSGSLSIDAVAMAGLSFSHRRDTLIIRLDRTYRPGEKAEIGISYHHKDTADNAFYSGGGFVFFDFPPEGARKCFPCRDEPSDKAKWELTAKVPPSVKLGSNGTLADSLITGDTVYYHWISRHPLATYQMTLSSSKEYKVDKQYWHKPDKPNDSIPVRFYYRQTEYPLPVEAVIGPMADFYSRKFGDYPFEKIGFATLNSLFHWGGMENQTMINLQADGWSEGLVSHEFAHSWFGDLITCGTWADIWLNESFATYCESLWLEHSRGYSYYTEHLKNQVAFYLRHNTGLPVYNPGWARHTPPAPMLYNAAVVYDKGACILHQLRCLLGDSVFFHILHEYATDTDLTFKNAVTKDFITKVNKVSGKDLSWFFDEWIYAPGHPVYANTCEIVRDGRKKWTVRFTMVQVQAKAPVFRMPVEILFGFSDNSDTVVRVSNETAKQVFEFTFAKRPVSAVFDPNDKILLREGTTLVIRSRRGK